MAAAERDASPLKCCHCCELTSPSLSELRVVLLGGSWSQRNLVRNLILGGKHFTTKPNTFIKITGTVENSKISVINTPDLQFLTVKEQTEFIRVCAAASDPGPHVFLLVLQPESFTEEEKIRIHQVLYHFNYKSFDHSLIMILKPRQEVSGLMEKCMNNPPLKELIRKCSYRYLHQTAVEPPELLTRFKQIVKENNREHVSFKEPEETMTPGGSEPAGEDEVSAFRIVLLGENENKKTELVNQMIKDSDLVIHKPSSQCVAYCGKWREKPVTMVTMVTFPDLSSLMKNKMRAELESCLDLCHPGPNVLLLLVNPSDFTEKKKEKLDSILGMFDGNVLKHSMVIKTDESHQTDLSSLITECEGRQYSMADNNHQNLLTEIEDIANRDQSASLVLKEEGEESKHDKTLQPSDPDSHERRGSDRLQMVLIGKTGSGKSSSGNTILGRKVFRAESSPRSITRTCQKADSEVDGRHVVVVDTPGLFDTNLTSDQVNEELKSCISLVAPGPHVFLLVLPIGRFTKEDRKTLRLIEEVLGPNYKRFTVVLFTRGDTLEHDDFPIEDYIEDECDEACKDLITDCRGRIHVFNNYKQNNRSQVTELIKMIDIIVKENEGSCYTREMLCGVNI